MQVHNLIAKLFKVKGIENADQLNPEEKKIFETWEKILSKETLTTEDISQFCKTQIGIIEGKWADYNVKNETKAELIPYHTVYKSLLSAMDAPQVARESIERQLISLTQNGNTGQ